MFIRLLCVSFLTGLLLNHSQPFYDRQEAGEGILCVRTYTAFQEFLHFRGNRHSAIPEIPFCFFPDISAGFPCSFSGIHLEHRQCPCIEIHPDFCRSAFRLFLGAVLQSASGRKRRIPVINPASCLRQTEISDLGIPVLGQKQISGLYILMNQAMFMGILQSSRRLNSDVHKPRLNFLLRPLIQGSVTDHVFQAAAIHPLGKNTGDSAYITDIITADDIRVQTKIDPVLAFFHKFFFAFFASLRKILRLRALHGQIHIPAHMVHAPHASHAAMNGVRKDLIGLQNLITFPDPLI